MKDAQKIATYVFITASILFGLVGVTIMLTTMGDQDPPVWQMKTLGVLVFVILSSFAVSVALKYLTNSKR